MEESKAGEQPKILNQFTETRIGDAGDLVWNKWSDGRVSVREINVPDRRGRRQGLEQGIDRFLSKKELKGIEIDWDKRTVGRKGLKYSDIIKIKP